MFIIKAKAKRLDYSFENYKIGPTTKSNNLIFMLLY